MRVLPLETDEINECWLSDKERFSYEGLNSPDRLQRPMVKRDGEWAETDWETALRFTAESLAGQDFGVLASPHATLEELHLAGKLGPADFRLRHADFSADGARAGIPWLGMSIPELEKLDRVLVVGAFLRKDQPLLAHRLRQAAKRGARIHMLHSVDDDWLMPIASRRIVPPAELAQQFDFFRESLSSGKNAAILLGNFAQQHPQAAAIHAAAQALAEATGARLGFLGEAANSVGGYLAGLPSGGNVASILERKAFVLLGMEPELDCADPQAALRALRQAAFVVQLSTWKTGLDYAHVLLPVAPFSETAGSFVNVEGRVQSFYATVNPLGEARPAWKVLRVLGSLLGRPGFELDDIAQVRAACLAGRDVSTLLSNKINLEKKETHTAEKTEGIQRIADVPIYFADPLVRRSPPLQKSRDARPPRAWMNAALLQKLGLAPGQQARIRQGEGEAKLEVALDDRLPDGCIRVAAGHPSTAVLGAMFGALGVEKVSIGKAA
jgi:NADH-quinone oxidoreductase subunit G